MLFSFMRFQLKRIILSSVSYPVPQILRIELEPTNTLNLPYMCPFMGSRILSWITLIEDIRVQSDSDEPRQEPSLTNYLMYFHITMQLSDAAILLMVSFQSLALLRPHTFFCSDPFLLQEI